MIKKFLLALAIAIPAMGFAQGKIGTVNIEALFSIMPEKATADEQIAAVSKTYEDENAKLEEEINKKIQEYQALAAETPASIRERRQQEIQDLDQRYQAFLQNAQQDLARQRQNLYTPIQEKLLDAIKTVGQEQGFTLIVPQEATLFTGADVIDLNDVVKTKLGVK